MRLVNIGNPDCRKILALLDSYLSNELTIETTAEVVRHLERCPQCLEIFRFRELVKRRLQAAIGNDEIPDEMRERVSRMIHDAGGSQIS